MVSSELLAESLTHSYTKDQSSCYCVQQTFDEFPIPYHCFIFWLCVTVNRLLVRGCGCKWSCLIEFKLPGAWYRNRKWETDERGANLWVCTVHVRSTVSYPVSTLHSWNISHSYSCNKAGRNISRLWTRAGINLASHGEISSTKKVKEGTEVIFYTSRNCSAGGKVWKFKVSCFAFTGCNLLQKLLPGELSVCLSLKLNLRLWTQRLYMKFTQWSFIKVGGPETDTFTKWPHRKFVCTVVLRSVWKSWHNGEWGRYTDQA